MKRTIIDYKIIDSFSPLVLINLVKDYIRIGWEPIGGFMVYGNSPMFSQAMVKYAPSDIPEISQSEKEMD